MRENRGPTGGLSPLFYLGSPTFASPHDARTRGKVSRQQSASAGPRERDFRRVSRDTRTTSRKGVLSPFKASQKNRLFGGKSRPFPALAPQTLKHPAGGSIPPISTHLKPRVSPGSPGFLCPYANWGELTCRAALDAGYCSTVTPGTSRRLRTVCVQRYRFTQACGLVSCFSFLEE